MKRVAIQGVAGCFHDIAARQFFSGEEVEVIPCDTFKDFFATIRKDNSILGAVAIENTIAGSLLPNHNMLKESGATILGETKLRIEHNLVAMPGQKISDITEVLSHPMALMQCEDFLSQYPNLKAVEAEETTKSGIILAAAAQEKPQTAEVIAVGPGAVIDGKEVKMEVKVGDKVILSKYSGTEVKLDGEELIVVRQNDILAIVE